MTPYQQIKERLRWVRAELILDVAEEMFAERGYHDSAIDEIAAHAGVAKGTLYQHVARNVDLACAFFERILPYSSRPSNGFPSPPLELAPD